MTHLSNLRHLRQFVAVAETGSVSQTAEMCFVTQPAVTQSIKKLEADLGVQLFERTGHGMQLNQYGKTVHDRVARALAHLDKAFGDELPKLRMSATRSQLAAIMAVCETASFTLAAQQLGLSQPTVHRAVSQIEGTLGIKLFHRSPAGTRPGKFARNVAAATRLAFSELAQCEAEIADLQGREGGQIVIGALPLARSYILPPALAQYRRDRPTIPIAVLEGRYEDLLSSVINGEIDFLVGALRAQSPIDDVVQEVLFEDELVLLSGNHHPIVELNDITVAQLSTYPWVVPKSGTPTRTKFDALFRDAGVAVPKSIIESGSLLLMREVLDATDHLGFISRLHADSEIRKGNLSQVRFAVRGPNREIGITFRKSWVPTVSQSALLSIIRRKARDLSGCETGRTVPQP